MAGSPSYLWPLIRLDSPTHRHFKGGQYVLIGWVRPWGTQADERLAFYRSMADGGLWLRPQSSFLSWHLDWLRFQPLVNNADLGLITERAVPSFLFPTHRAGEGERQWSLLGWARQSEDADGERHAVFIDPNIGQMWSLAESAVLRDLQPLTDFGDAFNLSAVSSMPPL